METKKTIFFGILVLSAMVLLLYSNLEEDKITHKKEVILSDFGKGPESPTSIKVYELIEKYSKQYNVPRYIAYNVSFKETRYGGPFDWNYNPAQESPVGAVGPMQIMLSTATRMHGKHIDKHELKTNIRLNIETSMRLLRKLHDKYGRWDLACGCYNTGRPMVNDYARFCVSNKNYRKNWESYN